MKKPPRYNIAFFGDNVFDGFEGPIWSSVAYTAQQHDVNLFSFASGPIAGWYRNSTVNLISPRYLDGIISITGTIGCHSSDEEIDVFYRRFSPLPIVSISRTICNAYNILVSNETGISQLMDHLIRDHHYRRIAFIRGPANNSEALLRLKAYRESLSRYGLIYDENFVYYGDFFWEGGKLAINAFLDERRLQLDAVVAANDYMAIFAVHELRRRGYRVPEDIAVVGFDDMEESKTMDLTTVRQPVVQLGAESVKILMSILDGETPQEGSCYLPTILVQRGSCGCTQNYDQDYAQFISCASKTRMHADQPLNELLERQFPEYTQRMGKDWPCDLLESIDEEKEEVFLSALDKGVREAYDKDLKMYSWYDILQTVEEKHPAFARDPKRQTWIKDAFKLIGKLTYEFKENEERLYYILNSFEDSFGILSWFKEYFPQLKIGSYFIARYEEGDKEKAKLLEYYHGKDFIDLGSVAEAFPTNALVPGDFRRDGERYSYYVLPVMQIGYALFEVGRLEKPAYYSLIGQISAAIKQTSLTHEIMKHASKLEQKVEERTKELKEAQEHLLEAAHQAGMAEIAINILHNVGNVLNSASISIEEIRKILDRPTLDGLKKVTEMLLNQKEDLGGFFTSDARAQLLPEYMAKTSDRIVSRDKAIAAEVDQVIEQMTLIHETVIMLQDYARQDVSEVLKESVHLSSIIDTALRIQEIYLRKNGVRVEKHIENVEKALSIEQNKLIHVLVNLIKNAVEAMEETPVDERNIIIRLLKTSEHEARIELTDHGVGIAEDHLTKIFMYGFTTKPNGHGFGLHTCANYIGEMGGSLTAESGGLKKGATFVLTLPLGNY